MANQQQVNLLLRDGVAAWNRWRKEEPDIHPNLKRANLRGAHLVRANLSKADLSEAYVAKASLRRANLSSATLFRADLSEADLTGATLFQADLIATNLRGATLSDADLSDANLPWANLSGANLTRADLGHATLLWADLTGADLTGVRLPRADLSEANLTRAILNGANLFRANLTQTDLSEANLVTATLSEGICLRTNFSHATLTGCNVYGIAAWDVNLEGAVQADLRITPGQDETDIMVDNLEVAQFLYLLMHNEKTRTILDTITSKVVLILGRFGDRKPILDALREALRRHPNGYIPVLFDFEPQTDKPVLETVKTLANLARFVIADLTDPHMVRAELTAIIPNVPTLPIQPIIQCDADVPTEYASWALFNSFLPVYGYADLSHLLASLSEAVITPVEGHVQARRL